MYVTGLSSLEDVERTFFAKQMLACVCLKIHDTNYYKVKKKGKC